MAVCMCANSALAPFHNDVLLLYEGVIHPHGGLTKSTYQKYNKHLLLGEA